MKRVSLALGLVALAAILAACSTSAAASPAAPAGSLAAGPTVVAKDLAFSPTSVDAPAGTAFGLVFDNQEAPPHNIVISDASGKQVFKGDIISSTKITYSVPALAAGSYSFHCEVHPAMTGTIAAK
ncbi:MAG: cupredoxin domain-containing protein [Chloroflexota bacterium]